MKYETIFRRLDEAVMPDIGQSSLQLAHCQNAAGKITREASRNQRPGCDFRVQIFQELIANRFIRAELQHQWLRGGKVSDWETRAVGFIDLSGQQVPVFVLRCETLGGEQVIQGNLNTVSMVPEIHELLSAIAAEWKAELLAA